MGLRGDTVCRHDGPAAGGIGHCARHLPTACIDPLVRYDCGMWNAATHATVDARMHLPAAIPAHRRHCMRLHTERNGLAGLAGLLGYFALCGSSVGYRTHPDVSAELSSHIHDRLLLRAPVCCDAPVHYSVTKPDLRVRCSRCVVHCSRDAHEVFEYDHHPRAPSNAICKAAMLQEHQEEQNEFDGHLHRNERLF